MPEIIFSKKDFQTRHWNHLHFGPNFVILGTALGCFSQFCFKKSFCRRSIMVATIFAQLY